MARADGPVDLAQLSVWDQEAGERISYEEVVVLDFFAHWCGPCVILSQKLHAMEADYRLKGHPVQIVPVNIEKRNPGATRRFIQQAGIKTAYADPSGNLVERFAISTLPFVVVLKRTSMEDLCDYNVVETFAGTPDMEAVDRALMDALKPEPSPAPAFDESVRAAQDPQATVFPEGGPEVSMAEVAERTETRSEQEELIEELTDTVEEPVIQFDPEVSPPTIDAFVEETADRTVMGVFDSLRSDDIQISNTALNVSFPVSDTELTVGLARNESQIDYQPSELDLVSSARMRDESMNRISLDGSLGVGEWHTGLFSLGTYSGFTDYKSVWIDEFYEQQFSLFPNYQDIDPQGYSLSLGTRWEYLPGLATVDVWLGYQYDRISPAYEAIPFEPLEVGLIDLDTASFRLVFENVLTPRIRLKQQIQLVDTTARDVRGSYFGTAHVALNDDWVLRVDMGATAESPGFDSFQSALSLEYDVDERWYFHGFVRRYDDSGEIVDPTIISTAAPALDTRLWGIGATWTSARWSAHFSWGDYKTDYRPVPASSFQFENLYLDRSWDYLRIQASTTF